MAQEPLIDAERLRATVAPNDRTPRGKPRRRRDPAARPVSDTFGRPGSMADAGSPGVSPKALAGATVIITGAGHGLGRAYALRFATEGANVIVAEIDPDSG